MSRQKKTKVRFTNEFFIPALTSVARVIQTVNDIPKVTDIITNMFYLNTISANQMASSDLKCISFSFVCSNF